MRSSLVDVTYEGGGPELSCGICHSDWESGHICARDDTDRDALAAYAHAAWGGWMDYLFEKSTHNPDGTVTIPAWAVERWKRQAKTPYGELPETERESDRKEADKVLKIMGMEK